MSGTLRRIDRGTIYLYLSYFRPRFLQHVPRACTPPQPERSA